MEYKQHVRQPATGIKPRVIIHGGAGDITRENLSPSSWQLYRSSLLRILRSTHDYLDCVSHHSSCIENPPNALGAAIQAVSQLESDPLFNAGIGAVFTRAGTIELEASVMVSRGYRKRGVGVNLLKHVRSPIKLAGEMLRRSEDDNGGGAQGHCQLGGAEAERLAKEWGLKMCDEKIFWTRKRWEQHKKGLERPVIDCEKKDMSSRHEHSPENFEWPVNDPGWDGHEYLPQGTVGAVVLDAYGTIAVATSTGGLTNKLPGRIGDTPTLGAGFWAEEWVERFQASLLDETITLGRQLSLSITSVLPLQYVAACLPAWMQNLQEHEHRPPLNPPRYRRRAIAMSGTGNGDSFLRLCAVRTAGALARFTNATRLPLQQAVSLVTGPNGELQRSAGPHWGKTGEGEGGIIGIELVGTTGIIVADFNRAMFRTWIDDHGKEQCMVFREEY